MAEAATNGRRTRGTTNEIYGWGEESRKLAVVRGFFFSILSLILLISMYRTLAFFVLVDK